MNEEIKIEKPHWEYTTDVIRTLERFRQVLRNNYDNFGLKEDQYFYYLDFIQSALDSASKSSEAHSRELRSELASQREGIAGILKAALNHE